MTPQLMQAIKLLQLSNLDLVAYVEAELERNPLLDRERGRRHGRRTSRATPTAAPDEPAARRRSVDRRRRPVRTSRSAIDDAPRHRRRRRLSRRRRAKPRARTAERPAGYSEWAGVGAGGRDDGDYNLEAFVSAETTLADWLREQLALAVADPARRMIGHYLIDLVDEAGYLSGDLAAVAEKLGTTIDRDRGGARHRAGLRSAGHVRAQPRRMPGDAAQGARPLRSGDGRP